MFDHASGELIFELIYELACRAGWVVMPVGCPVCITDTAQAGSVPSELVAATGLVTVRSGKDILAVIRAA